MSVPIEQVLARADEGFYQDILGRSQIEILRVIRGDRVTIADLRAHLEALRSHSDLLQKKKDRNKLIELLRRHEAEALCKLLKVPLKDNPYISLIQTNFKRGSSKEKELLRFFAVEAPPIRLEDSGPSRTKVTPIYALFDHQRRACEEVAQSLATKPSRCILHMPTGSGKTRTAMNLIAEHLRGSGRLVVWLAYSSELCDQACEEFEKAWVALGNGYIDVFRYWGSHDVDLSSIETGFLIAGFGKLYNHFKGDHAPLLTVGTRATLVVVDEAHQSIAPTYETVINMLVCDPDTLLLGLTATPGRTSDEPSEDRKLSGYFAKKKVTLNIEGFNNPVDYLVRQGYLAKVEYRSLDYDGKISLSPVEIESISASLDISGEILDRLAVHTQRNIRLLFEVQRLVSEGHLRIILFATTVDHAKEVSALLSIQGIKSDFVTGQTQSDQRRHLIDAYKERTDEPFVLCNYGVLTTGFDAPLTSAAIIARPTKSLVLYSQMVGRAIRGPKAGGNSRAVVVTTVDFDEPGFQSVGSAFLNWEDVY